MEDKDLELLTNQDIPENVRSKIAERLFGAQDRVAERAIETERLLHERRKLFWNTPLVAALAGLLTLSATFVFDRITANDATNNTITLEEVRKELELSEARLTQELEIASNESLARLEAQAREREFQYEIVRSQMERQGATNADRAAVLLFLARAGVLNALDRDELTLMAREQQQNPETNIIPPLSSQDDDSPFERRFLYPNGSTVTYSFVETPTERSREIVEDAIGEWSQHVNLRFEFIDQSQGADIRILPDGDRTGSRIGPALGAALVQRETMWLPRNLQLHTALHEFGHAIGFLDEHRNPQSTVSFNREAAATYFDNTFSMPVSFVERILFQHSPIPYPCRRDFDPNSIMMSFIPAEITSDGRSYQQGRRLSSSDIDCASQMYPRQTPN